jgi:hypothetical protein
MWRLFAFSAPAKASCRYIRPKPELTKNLVSPLDRRYIMGFVEHLREFVGKEAKLDKLQGSMHGARYTYILEFTPGYPKGETVILKDVWAEGVLIEYIETKKQREIPLDRIQLGSLK